MNPITRKEMFLAAAGGQDVETPTPVTREEVFLEEIAKGGGSSLPSTETASAGDVLSLDDNKKPQWAAPSGGGVLVVHEAFGGTLDKTWQEINDAGISILFVNDGHRKHVAYFASVYAKSPSWEVVYAYVESDGTIYTSTYTTDSADGYPVYVDA